MVTNNLILNQMSVKHFLIRPLFKTSKSKYEKCKIDFKTGTSYRNGKNSPLFIA